MRLRTHPPASVVAHPQRAATRVQRRLLSGDDSSSSTARVQRRLLCSNISNSSSSDGASQSDEEAHEQEQRRRRRMEERSNSIQRSCLECGDAPAAAGAAGSATQSLQSISCFEQADLPKHHTSRRGVSNRVQLSVYPDAIGSGLADLNRFLATHIQDAAGSVHLLPLFPSSGDRGFAPLTYSTVDPAFGTWQDVEDLASGSGYQLCVEYMANHISPASEQFQDYLQHGSASQYAGMFVRWDAVWPDGKPTAEMLAKVRTRKPTPPVLRVTMGDGSVVPLWCTFSDQQIDINPFTEEGWAFTAASLASLCEHGATLIRLDALGYVTKRANTPCFMEAPEVWELLDKIRAFVKPWGAQLLCEVHEDFNQSIALARRGYWTYDFSLPLLVLHALRFRTAHPLRNWLSICPRRQITTLDTHDGMGLDDVAGLAPLVDVQELQSCILGHGANINKKHFFTPHKCNADAGGDGCQASVPALQAVADFLGPDCLEGCYTSTAHQLNATFFSAVEECPKQYLLARAVQFFTPGVPMVYYVGLLAGVNDYELLAKGSIRDINRHSYSLEEAESAVQQPVVQALLKLCRFRNHHPAFQGRVFVDDQAAPHLLRVCWYQGSSHLAVLKVDFQAREFSIRHTPYAAPPAAETTSSAELDAFHTDFTLGMADVFSVDALDPAGRASTRTNAVLDDADVTVGESPQQPEGAVSSSNSATDSDVESPTAGAASHEQWLNAGGAGTHSAVGVAAAAAGDGYSRGGAAKAALQAREEAHEREMARKALRWDLVVLDLSWAWAGGAQPGQGEESVGAPQPQPQEEEGLAARAR